MIEGLLAETDGGVPVCETCVFDDEGDRLMILGRMECAPARDPTVLNAPGNLIEVHMASGMLTMEALTVYHADGRAERIDPEWIPEGEPARRIEVRI